MEQHRRPSQVNGANMPMLGVMIACLAAILACNTSSSSKLRETAAGNGRADEQTREAPAQSNSGPGIDLNCVFDHLQNPPESFHYVYQKVDSDGSNVRQEADVSPQAIDGFRAQPDGSQQPLHGVRSDAQTWQAALAGVTGISGMAGTVATFNHNSAMKRETDGGQVNGYDTIHYSIDTARWDATERQLLGNFALGPGGYDKGDVWVTPKGCPVKFFLDEEMHKNDGSLLDKIHYEESMVKK
jgi:hypothetical protein